MPTFGDAWKASDLSKLPQLQPRPTVEQMFQPFYQGDPSEKQPCQWAPEPIPALEVLPPRVPAAVTLLIKPRPAERPRFSKFGGAYNSKNYSDYKKQLVELLKRKIFEGQILLPADYAGLTVDFYLPVPKSWTRKEKAAAYGKLHRSKPDADNYLKACADSLEEAGVFVNDGQVAQMTARKWYVKEDAEPRIELRLQTLEELETNLL